MCLASGEFNTDGNKNVSYLIYLATAMRFLRFLSIKLSVRVS